MFEKRELKARQRLSARFVYGAYDRFKNLSAAVNATKSGTWILVRERGLRSKVNFFCTKIV